MDEGKKGNGHQNLILENREQLSLSGVQHVDRFDDNTIVLTTVKGGLTIKGQELNISKLNLEDGNVKIEGMIDAIAYSNREASKSKGNGLLGRMFK